MKPTAHEIYSQLYDVYVHDWPGEIDFYRNLLASTELSASGVLEIACGTGRVTIPLARTGVDITGIDLSTEQLDKARQKSAGMSNIHWVNGDMRTFELGRKFGIAIIPGHSFQFLNTPGDQVQCLENIRRHLVSGGLLVVHLDHQDFPWLGSLVADKERGFIKGPLLTHPLTGQTFRKSHRWTYEPSTQIATVQLNWEQVGPEGEMVDVWEMDLMQLHCVFRFEMEHLLYRAGFSVEALYGDFFKNPLADQSENMIWVACNLTS